MKKYDLENMEISIKDWLCYVCAKWRSIIVTMLIFALLAGGYGYVKPSDEPAEPEVGDAVELSSDMLRLLDYHRLQDSHQKYLQESPLMQMDASKVNCLTLKYYVSLDDETVADVIQAENIVCALIEAYENEISDASLHAEIAEKSNGMIDAIYVPELISVNGEYSVSMLTTEELQLVSQRQNASHISGILSVTMKGYDEAFCQMIADCIDTRIVKITENLTEKVGAHTLQLISSSSVTMHDSTLLEKRYEMLAKAQTISTNITNIEKTFSDAEKAYVEKILTGEVGVESALAEQEATFSNAEQMTERAAQSSISLKYTLIGLIFGAFLMAGFWTLQYIMSGKLRTSDDLEAMWDVKTYTRKPVDKKRFCVDKLIYDVKNSGIHMFNDEELIEVLKAEIQILADKQGFRKFFITGTDLSDDDKKWVENLKNALKDTDISLTLGNNVLYNPASLALLADADAVLLCEQLGISSYTEICKELQTCADKEIAVIGCVVSGV